MSQELPPPVMVGLFPTQPDRRGDDTANPWYRDYGNVVRVARYLSENGAESEEIVRMLEKPWHHMHNWQAMLTVESRRLLPFPPGDQG